MRPVLLSIFLLLTAAAAPPERASAQADPVPAAAQDAGADSAAAAPASVAYPAPASPLPESVQRARTQRAYWHVFAAFAVAWVLLLGYAVSLGRRFSRLDAEVRRMRGAPE